jgi:hypothetical protein
VLLGAFPIAGAMESHCPFQVEPCRIHVLSNGLVVHPNSPFSLKEPGCGLNPTDPAASASIVQVHSRYARRAFPKISTAAMQGMLRSLEFFSASFGQLLKPQAETTVFCLP